MHKEISYRFTQACVRKPGPSVINGLRAVERGIPDFKKFEGQHTYYVAVLEKAGLRVTVLPALEAFPDSVFIEDSALCLPEGSIILRPGTATRLGEAQESAVALSQLGRPVFEISPGGTIDGGDILVTGSAILVGLSERTNLAGFESLNEILSAWGYKAQAVHTPAEVLHFKSDSNALDDETLLVTSRLSEDPQLQRYKLIEVPAGEEAAANSIRINDTLLVPRGFPATADLLDRAGYNIEEVPISQAALLDGGLSCMSLRY